MSEKKVAIIDHIVTDQGNGAAFCGECKKKLTENPCEHFDVCPHCGAEFVGHFLHSYNFGGSDF